MPKRAGTAFRCVPARNEPCIRPFYAVAKGDQIFNRGAKPFRPAVDASAIVLGGLTTQAA